MKAVSLPCPKNMVVSDIPQPVCEAGQLKIKVEWVGVCGSDVAAYRGASPLCTYPRIIGHEIVGTVVEVNSAAEVNPQDAACRVGDRIVIEPYIYCGKCYPCSRGATNCCENLKVLGVHVDGGMSEYFCHPAHLAYTVPPEIPGEELAMVEPLSIAYHAVNRVNVGEGEHVVIMGAGAIGNLVAQVSLVRGAIPILVDVLEKRLSLGQAVGVHHTINPAKGNLLEEVREITAGRMAECVIEATGATPAIREVLGLAAHTGRVALVGWPNEEIAIPTRLITFKELEVYGSRTSARQFPPVIDLIASGKVKVRPLISDVVAPDKIPETMKRLAERPEDSMKVVVEF